MADPLQPTGRSDKEIHKLPSTKIVNKEHEDIAGLPGHIQEFGQKLDKIVSHNDTTIIYYLSCSGSYDDLSTIRR